MFKLLVGGGKTAFVWKYVIKGNLSYYIKFVQ